jgi:hypothetical protein
VGSWRQRDKVQRSEPFGFFQYCYSAAKLAHFSELIGEQSPQRMCVLTTVVVHEQSLHKKKTLVVLHARFKKKEGD